MKQRSTVVCRCDRKIMLVTRDYTRWSLPGGKVRQGELPHDAARRELEEETQLVARNLTWLFEFCGRNTVHQVFDATVAIDGVPRASREIAGYEWVGMTEIEQMPTSVVTRAIVQLLFQNGEKVPFALAEAPVALIVKNLHG